MSKEIPIEEIKEAADKHSVVRGAKTRINKKEFYEELGEEYTSLQEALENREVEDQ